MIRESKKYNGIAVSYLRISLGASDLNSEVFSYDDMPSGQTDDDPLRAGAVADHRRQRSHPV